MFGFLIFMIRVMYLMIKWSILATIAMLSLLTTMVVLGVQGMVEFYEAHRQKR